MWDLACLDCGRVFLVCDAAKDEIADQVELGILVLRVISTGEAGEFIVDSDIDLLDGVGAGEDANGIERGVAIGLVLCEEDGFNFPTSAGDGFLGGGIAHVMRECVGDSGRFRAYLGWFSVGFFGLVPRICLLGTNSDEPCGLGGA